MSTMFVLGKLNQDLVDKSMVRLTDFLGVIGGINHNDAKLYTPVLARFASLCEELLQH